MHLFHRLAWRHASALLGLSCAFTVPVGAQSVVFVGPPSDPGCDYESVQEAIDNWAVSTSTEFLVVHVANAHAYTAQRITVPTPVASTGISLRGQYPGCALEGGGGRALLSGVGAPPGPVIDVIGTGVRFEVNVSHMEIAHGANPGGNGGGVRVRGNVLVGLFESVVRDNTAALGGGIAVESTAAGQPDVVMTGSAVPTIVDGNQASEGGGLYCSGSILRCNRYCRVSANVATGNGGGIAHHDCLTSLSFSRNQLPLDPLVGLRGNSAGGDGGGVWASGGELRLGAFGSPGPAPVVGNSAGGDGGGALFTGAISGGGFGVQFDGNTAIGSGGGLAVRGGLPSFGPTGGGFDCRGTLDTCPRWRDNAAGVRGGAVHVEGAALGVSITASLVDGNQAASASVLDLQGSSGGAVLRNTQVAGNSGAGELFLLDGGSLGLHYATIADNGTDDSALVRLEAPSTFSALNTVMFDDNGAGGGVVLEAAAGSTIQVDCMLVHEDSALGGQPGVGGLVVADPQWDDSGEFDASLYVPGPGSAAVDACSAGPGSIPDLLGTPRPQDTPLPDLAGPYDMGAIERRASVAIFRDGFEPAP